MPKKYEANKEFAWLYACWVKVDQMPIMFRRILFRVFPLPVWKSHRTLPLLCQWNLERNKSRHLIPSQNNITWKTFCLFFFRQQKKLYRATSQHSTSLFSVQAFCQGKYARRVRILQRKIRIIRVGEDHYGLKITTLAEFSGWRRNRDLLTSRKENPWL